MTMDQKGRRARCLTTGDSRDMSFGWWFLGLLTASNVSGVRAWTLSATTLAARDNRMAMPLRRMYLPWTIVDELKDRKKSDG